MIKLIHYHGHQHDKNDSFKMINNILRIKRKTLLFEDNIAMLGITVKIHKCQQIMTEGS